MWLYDGANFSATIKIFNKIKHGEPAIYQETHYMQQEKIASLKACIYT